MKNVHYCTAIFVVTAGIFLSGCTEKVVAPVIGTGAPGNIHGKVTMYDTVLDPFTYKGAMKIDDASGVQVGVEGTSYSTMTDEQGNWHLSNIPSGTYPSIIFSKPGFATQKATNLASSIGYTIVNNGDVAVNIDMYRRSLISCGIILRAFQDYTQYGYHDTVIAGNGAYPIYTTVEDSVRIPYGAATFSTRILDQFFNSFYPCYGELFFGTDPHVDALDPSTFLYSTGTQSFYSSFSGIIDVVILRSTLINAGFRPGQTIYCVAYCGGQFFQNSYYIDMKTGNTIYSGLSPNHSEVKSFILPP
jgi:hypothetical protein